MATLKHWTVDRITSEWNTLPFKDLLLGPESHSAVREVLAGFALRSSAREPSILISRLLTEVRMDPSSVLRTIPGEEALIAGSTAAGSESMEVDYVDQLEWSASLEKASVVLRATHEQLMADSQGVLKRIAELAGRALARLKERRVVDFILSSGTLVLDNNSSEVKSSTGRDATGLRNGTLTIQDVVGLVEDLLGQGYLANTFICNPRSALSWWAQASWREWWGSSSSWQEDNVGNKSRASLVVPKGMPSQWKLCLSIYVPEGSLIIASHEYLGELLVDYPIRHENWDDPQRDLRRSKFTESYGININEAAVVLGRNLNVTDLAYDFGQTVNLGLTGLVDGLTGDLSFSGSVGQ